MEIKFHFNFEKAVQVMAFFILRLGSVEKVKLMKLVYIADKQHFLIHGFPLTGDRQCAMPWGPVPSDCLHAVNGELWPNAQAAFTFLHVSDNLVSLKTDPGLGSLSAPEIETLEQVVAQHGSKNRWKLVGETHRLPEYREVYVAGGSRTITYESMLRFANRAGAFDLGRPVIASNTLVHMVNPFPGSETDL